MVTGLGDRRLRRGDALCIAFAGSAKAASRDAGCPAVECTMDSPLRAATTGQRVFYDDGKFGAVVERTAAWGLAVRIETCEGKGVRVKREKGLNFPDTDFAVDAMTEKDVADLDFVAAHADAVEYSFVQSAADVARLQEALAQRRKDWRQLAIVLKIETQHAIDRLPEILVQAASQQPAAVMIARGDLAVEIGFDRMAEMQEEMLWLAEAAHIPSIWATQVLGHLVSKGTPLRGEMTDAAMAARAECVMLNKGPFLREALDSLSTLLQRMALHQHKKTPELRPLRRWHG
jgi:pyruvate kinase